MAERGNGASRVGRPRAGEGRLSKEVILEAALRIVDDEGLDALTMRGLASALDVNPMSIYHHLPGKKAVLSGLVESVFSQVQPSSPAQDATWQERLRDAARSYRRVLRAHPNLALQILADTSVVADAVVAAGEPFYDALERAGLPPPAIVEAVDTLVDFIHGFMLGESTSTSATFELGPEILARVEGLPPGTAPALTRVARALGAEGLRYDFDTGFEAALDIIVQGIETTGGKHTGPS